MVAGCKAATTSEAQGKLSVTEMKLLASLIALVLLVPTANAQTNTRGPKTRTDSSGLQVS
jgi:hypothetical protein